MHYWIKKNTNLLLFSCLTHGAIWLILSSFQESYAPFQKLGFLFFEHVDYLYFIKPVDNFFETSFVSYDGKEPFAGRMPGYWFPYLVLRFIFNRVLAIKALISLQLIFSILASVFLCNLLESFKQLKTSKLGYLIVLLFTFNPFLFPYLNQTISESFSISALIIFLYFYFKYADTKSLKSLFMAGVFMSWLIFLRPFTGLVLLLAPMTLLLLGAKERRNSILAVLLLTTPFILVETIWVGRNYIALDKVIPLTTRVSQYGKIYSNGWQESRSLIFHLGEGANFFDPGLANWLRKDTSKSVPKIDLKHTGILTVDLMRLKTYYQKSMNCKNDFCFDYYDRMTVQLANELNHRVKTSNPFHYFVRSNLNALKRLVISSGSSQVPIQASTVPPNVYRGLKTFWALFYYISLIIGLLVLIYTSRNNWKARFLLGYFILITATLVFYGTSQEPRYFITAYLVAFMGFLTGISYLKKARTKAMNN